MQIKLLHEDAVLPEFTAGNNAIDLRVIIDKPYYILMPGETKLFGTGMAMHIGSEDKKLAGFILPRSGLGHKYGIVLGNLTGLIDESFDQELKFSLWNRSKYPFKFMHKYSAAQKVFINN